MDELTGVISIITNGGSTALLLVLGYLFITGRLNSAAATEAIISQTVTRTVERLTPLLTEQYTAVMEHLKAMGSQRDRDIASEVARILMAQTPLPPNRGNPGA